MATYLPFSDIVAAYGYRQPPPTKLNGTGLGLAFLYVVIGGALGTVVGTGLAMATFHQGIPAFVLQSAPPATTPAELSNTPAPAPSQSAAVQGQPHVAPASLEMSSSHKLLHTTAFITHHRTQAPQRSLTPAPAVKPHLVPVVAQAVVTQPAVITQPAVMTQPAVSTNTKTFVFFSEGDATVADFDTSNGRLETYDGRTFVISNTRVAGNVQSWQDYRADVHYRCDQSGNCTLMRSGVVVPNARLLL